jgi:hypothetical protein
MRVSSQMARDESGRSSEGETPSIGMAMLDHYVRQFWRDGRETKVLTLNSAAFFNFRGLPLSAAARNRLGAIAESQIQHPHQRCELLKIILATAYDPQRGLYVPLSDTAELAGYVTEDIENLPVAVSSIEGWRHTLFGNALMLRVPGSPRPSSPSTNAGFLVVTHEFDCETKEQFEETGIDGVMLAILVTLFFPDQTTVRSSDIWQNDPAWFRRCCQATPCRGPR